MSALAFVLASAGAAGPFSALAAAEPVSGVASAGSVTGGPAASGRPYAVVDKRRAMITVHLADGRVAGSSAVLLGSALGDHSVPGVGDRTEAGRLRAQDKTTPAGRFSVEQGRNLQGETVLWLDHEAALAIHRLRPGRSAEKRAQALAWGDPSERRLSDGCVVVPGAFFDRIVLPVLGTGTGLVVVLPEGDAMARLSDEH